MNSLVSQKKQLRQVAAARREAFAAGRDIGPALCEQFGRLGDLPHIASVSGYWPIGSEANVMPLLCELGQRGLEMALPVVPGRGETLTFRRWRQEDTMGTGPFGIREPLPESPIVEPDLLLVPLLLFDRMGGRLGYGGGYYDRTISALRARKSILAVGIAYAKQEYDTVPCAEWDAPIDWIVTETAAIKARGPESI
jgi:5-formyltetrahydrofolate cyclo-ligase